MAHAGTHKGDDRSQEAGMGTMLKKYLVSPTCMCPGLWCMPLTPPSVTLGMTLPTKTKRALKSSSSNVLVSTHSRAVLPVFFRKTFGMLPWYSSAPVKLSMRCTKMRPLTW
eukprot:15469054-Alexandrium_andersonii.AAC.2